jgi:excisionase family DNA binding protein
VTSPVHGAAMTSQAAPLATARPTRPRGELPCLVAIEQIAVHLDVSVRHVRRLVFERRIPYVKWGHLIRFDIDEVSAWVASSRVPAADDNRVVARR